MMTLKMYRNFIEAAEEGGLAVHGAGAAVAPEPAAERLCFSRNS